MILLLLQRLNDKIVECVAVGTRQNGGGFQFSNDGFN